MIAFQSLDQARNQISDKTPVGSVLRSRDWESIPLALRQRAQFSAGVTSAQLLQMIQDQLTGELSQSVETLPDGRTRFRDRDTFINRLRDLGRKLGLDQLVDPAKRGTLQDITSVPRLGLIHDMQVSQANEFARWKMDQSEGALLLYPAQEFKRIESRREPRRTWLQRWADAGGELFDGRMIALKGAETWQRLSRFGTPWPPYDYGSGMGIEDISRDEAIRLGVISESDAAQPQTPSRSDFNEYLEASVTDLDSRTQQQLKSYFGEQVEITNGRAQWRAAA